ncbi:MAG: MFS transporter [Actinomycetota bacterium]|nr:MFS transporter [Actinomycetota bacterium]
MLKFYWAERESRGGTETLHSIRASLPRLRTPFYGWAVVVVATLATFCSGPGQSFVFSVFVDPILQDTGISRVHLSTLYAFGTAVSAAMVVLVARLVDRFGARLMLAVIALGLGVACFGMSLAAGSVALLLGFAAMRALGQGSLPVTATMLTAQWFVRQRGRAMSVVFLGLAASNAVLPAAAQGLIGSVGWREAYVALGVMVWALLIPTAILIVRNRPEAVGLNPDGASEPVEDPGGETAGEKRGSWQVVVSRDFWLLAVPLAAVPFVVTALVFHQVSVLGERGVGAGVAAAVFVAFAVASAAATAISGMLVEWLGPRKPLIFSQGVLLLAVSGLQLVSTPFMAAAYAALLGSASGMQGVVAGVIWAHYYGRRGLGKVQGPASTVMISAAALAPLPLAALHQLSGNYTLGLILIAAIPVVCAIMACFFDPKRARREAETDQL